MSVTETRSVASIIGGRVRDGGTRVESRNPANLDEVVCEAVLADAGAFADACSAARAAQPGWAATPAPVRGKAIGRIGRLVEDNKEALARLLTREIGKPYPESLGEVQEVVDTCDFFVSEGRRLYGQTVPSELPDKQLFTFRNPVGVAAIITAGNFPVAARRRRHGQDTAPQPEGLARADRSRTDRGVARPRHQHPLDLAGDLPRAARARARPHLDDRLRQQPPRRGADRQAPQRDAFRRGRGGAPSD